MTTLPPPPREAAADLPPPPVAQPIPGSFPAEPPPAAPGAPDDRPSRPSFRARLDELDLRNTWQVAAGAVMFPLGLIIILFSWYGSAHTGFVQQQIPYLVSGSFIGLGLMIVGGLLYFAHWLYRIYDQADLHQAEHLRVQTELLAAIERLAERQPPARRPLSASSAAVTAPVAAHAGNGSGSYVATASGTLVHRPDCPVVARHPDDLEVVSAADAALRPHCQICQP